MLTLDELQALLKDRRISMISEATGIHRNTITAIRDSGERANPSYAVLKALSDYFKA